VCVFLHIICYIVLYVNSSTIGSDAPYLENAHNFFGEEGARVGGLRHAHPGVVGQDDYAVHLGVLRLNQLLQRQVEGPHVVHKRIIVWFPFSCTKDVHERSSQYINQYQETWQFKLIWAMISARPTCSEFTWTLHNPPAFPLQILALTCVFLHLGIINST